MTTYMNRTTAEQEIIRKAYEFELEALRNESDEPNPYFQAVRAMDDGKAVWFAISDAISMAMGQPLD